ncbi:MAG: zinc ribbon domain-containing protein, partial [Nitrospiraceae bacterium]
LEAVSAGLVSELAELEQKRKASVALLDSKLLERYKKLKAARKDLAVAPLRDGICFGCRLQLPPQLVAEVKRSNELQSCTYCQRILYWDGVPAPAAATEPVESPDDLKETV